MYTPSPDRRLAMKTLIPAGLTALTAGEVFSHEAASKIKGNIKQSICRWCYGRIKLPELAQEAKKIGYQSIELLSPNEVLEVKKFGLTCAILGGADIANGLNRKENHDGILKKLTDGIEFAATEGVPSVICMSGNRRGLADDEGLKVCADGLKRVIGLAEKKKVTLIMEGLNSKVDHKDYMYDKTIWGVELCKKVGSDRFKLLYDIYHMQIMEGDVMRTIKQYHEYIGHYHTGGNPGRNEIDETQELNYPAIVKAIISTGYKGYLGQEFIPKRDPIASMAQAFKLCDV
ncbi:MAG: hydroxypyruvate isomerase [Planctomycetia bacterium]|nr:hydroxypyruvate isomerase [Planctomycetia bacterium]